MEPRIAADLRRSYGIDCEETTPVAGGWLNKKWKVVSDKGVFLVKQYSTERFNRRNLAEIDAALKRQMLLEEKGIPCPHILPHGKEAVREIDGNLFYMVMSFCEGVVEGFSTIRARQMRSLGRVCGAMHQAFSAIPPQGVKGFPLCGEQILSALWTNYRALSGRFSQEDPDEYKTAVLAQEAILRDIPIDFFEGLTKGIAHEDFTPDNMLFHPDGVSAIIDFDRNQYSFLEHDVGRAMVSLALGEGRMDRERIDSFVEGYTRCRRLSTSDIANALRVTWCIEAPWWIRPEFFVNASPKVNRFKEEILWLTKHWFELESLLFER